MLQAQRTQLTSGQQLVDRVLGTLDPEHRQILPVILVIDLPVQ
jgi:hypothetical protein